MFDNKYDLNIQEFRFVQGDSWQIDRQTPQVIIFYLYNNLDTENVLFLNPLEIFFNICIFFEFYNIFKFK